MDNYNIWAWIILIGLFIILLAFDMLVLNKGNKPISSQKALYETLFFVSSALLFGLIIYFFYDHKFLDNPENLSPTKALFKYYSGYLIELSLSIDNLFVIALIFTSYKIPAKNRHHLLFLGILGAIIFRGILISFGLLLIHKFHWITVVFGLFLIYTAFRMLREEEEEFHEPKGMSKIFRTTKIFDGDKFITHHNGKKVFTALFSALISIEFADLLFALDSIPAVFAITTDPYIVFSSNIFAILGLRSMYYFLASLLEKFGLIKYSVFFILLFVAFKLITAQWIEIPDWVSLLFIVIALGTGIVFSILKNRKNN